jgi:hypothetical protein
VPVNAGSDVLINEGRIYKLSIPGGVAGNGAIWPVYRGISNKGVTSFDLFVFARSARPLERAGVAHCVPCVLPAK